MSTPRPTVSDAAERLYDKMRAYQDGDADGGWVLLHLCEARARTSLKVREAVRHDEIGSGRRRMHDPQRAPDWYLPRLRDLVGNNDQGLTGTALRSSIQERPRARRCTRPAMVSAVLATLTGATAADVRILERLDDNPYRLAVVTRTAHTPDPAATLRAARAHKPLFVKLFHLINDDVLIGDATLTFGQVGPAVTLGNAVLGDI